MFLHLLLRHHIILHDDPGEGSVFKNYAHWDNFDWNLSRFRYQCEINTQWENWAEGTPGHSDNRQGKIHKTAMAWSDILLREWSHIYRVEYWADYMCGDTKHRVSLSLWGNKIMLFISYKPIVLWFTGVPTDCAQISKENYIVQH